MESHLICNNCGGRYQAIETDSPHDNTSLPDKKSSAIGYKNKVEIKYYRYQCPACGAVKPKISYNEENELTYRAFQLLAESKFEEADAAFDAVLAKYPENVEAYWGKVKVRYRVIYKENAKGKLRPTCEKSDHGSVSKDENYKKAFQYADERIQKFLKKQANALDRVLGLKTKQAVAVALASCVVLGAGSFGAYYLFRHEHTLVTDADIAPTCTAMGMTGKTYCDDCGEILKESERIAMRAHTFEWVTVTPPTKTEEGLRTYRCTACGTETKTESIPVEMFDGLAYALNEDRLTCTIIGIGACTDTNIRIPKEIDGYRVTGIGSYAFDGCENLTSIVIPDGVTSIAGSAFENCTGLKLVSLPQGLTDIGNYAFYNCMSLTGIALPDSVTGIGSYAFYGCGGLTSMVLPEGLTSIGENTFSACASLADIVLPSTLTSIGDLAFYDCASLTNMTLPDGLTHIGAYTFHNCTNLTSVRIPDSVTSIGDSAFYDCTSLTEIRYSGTTAQWKAIAKVQNWDTDTGDYTVICKNGTVDKNGYGITYSDGLVFAKNADGTYTVSGIGGYCTDADIVIPPTYNGGAVTGIGERAFYGRERLTSVKIPDSVTSIGQYAFYNCTGLTSIVIPEGVTTILNKAFYNCTSLTSIALPDSVTSIGTEAFISCYRLKEITVGDGNPYYCAQNGVLFNQNKTRLICYPAQKTGNSYTIPDSVTSIGDQAFYACTRLTNITIPDSVTRIGYYAFYNCTKLTDIRYGGYTAQWQNIVKMSSWSTGTGEYIVTCANGTIAKDGTVTIYGEGLVYTQNADGTYTVSGIGTCTDADLIIPSTYNGGTVTAIGERAFYNCMGLTSVKLHAGLTIIGDSAFEGCTSLTSISIPDGVTSIGNSAFSYCTSLKRITLPDGVTSIGNSAFSYCTGLTSIALPDSVTGVGEYAFSGCAGLTKMTLPNSLTGIGYCAFYGCTGLTSITISDNVTSIGDYAFRNCTKLTDIRYNGTPTQWQAITKGYDWDNNTDEYTITCTNGEVSKDGTAITYSEGLAFTKNADGTYTVSGIGSCTDADIVIPPTYNGGKVTSIGICAFTNCTSLTSIVIPDSVTEFGTQAFSGCTGLTSVVLPDGLTSIGDSAFDGCTRLTSIALPDGVTSIGHSAFLACTGLTSVVLPEGLTSIGYWAFGECENLTSVEIPDSLTSIGSGAFADCPKLETITVSDSNPNYCVLGGVLFNKNVTELICYPAGKIESTYTTPESVTAIAHEAFSGCDRLTSIAISDGVTSIGDYAFSYCTSLTGIDLPDGVTSIGNGAFVSCRSLTDIKLPEGLTSIGDYAFFSCTNLTSIEIPDSLTSIGVQVFFYCISLTEIHYGGTTAQWKEISKGSDWDISTGEYTVICKNGTVSKNGFVTPN